MSINNSLVKRKPTFSAFMTSDGVRTRINQMVGGKDGQRFISAIVSAVSVNPALQECESSSILSAAVFSVIGLAGLFFVAKEAKNESR